MPSSSLPAALILSLAAPGALAQETGPLDGVALAQLTIHQRIVIRVPRMPAPYPVGRVPTDAPPVVWVEKKSAKCVPAKTLAAAAVTRADSVDLMVRDGSRLRAKLGDDCPALGFYTGFYVQGTKDGLICAHRDSIHSRSGANCPIVAFKQLVPAR